MRRSTVMLTFITAGITLGLFQLKYTVMSLEQEHKKINNIIRTTNESIHVLKAEWAFLNRPDRLQQLAQKHLDIHPIDAKQLVSFKTLGDNYGVDSQVMATQDEPEFFISQQDSRHELDQLVAQVTAAVPAKKGER